MTYPVALRKTDEGYSVSCPAPNDSIKLRVAV